MSQKKRLTTAETATLLGITERRVRQLGPMLGGAKGPDGNMTFDRGAVVEHAEMRGRQRTASMTTQQVGLMAEQMGVMQRQIADLTLHTRNLWMAVNELQHAVLEHHPEEEHLNTVSDSEASQQPGAERSSSSGDG